MSSASTTGGGQQVTGTAYAPFLAQLPFFAGVPPEDVTTFADAALVRQYPAGKDIVVQRQFGHAMFVLIHGTVAITVDSEAGVLKVGTLGKPGDYFGEAALLGRGERTATVTAETEVMLLELEKHRFDLLCRRHRSVRDHLEGVYHQRAIATYLSTHRYLGRLDEPARAELARGATLKMYQRGDAIQKRGDAADSILVIKDGVVKASRTNQAGGPVSILAYFNTHDVVGVSDVRKRDYDLDAVGQCEVIFVSGKSFALVMANFPNVAAHFGKDDMNRHEAMAMAANKTVLGVVQKFLDAGVEVESLLVINLDRCVRCGNCVRACHTRHEYTRLDRRGPIFRRRAEMKTEGKHEHLMLPASCRHCRDPECMIGCPTGAIQRNPAGDVDINNNCIGCENCARKCPYGNITMRPLEEKDRPSPEITKRAIKCNLCRNYSYSNCVHECPRGAILRVDPLRYFEELALVMESEQREAIEWERAQAKGRGMLGTKQLVKGRSTWFIPASFAIGAVLLLAVFAAVFTSSAPLRGSSKVGLPLGIMAATCMLSAAFLGARKRLANGEVAGDEKKKIAPRKKIFPRGQLESWTQFHMMLGLVGFITACAHAGFHVTGVFTTLLMLVFAFEVITGAWGQRIYMTVPKTLTRLERHGLARLVEDLIDEDATLTLALAELAATLPAKLWRTVQAQVEAAAGTIGQRFKPSYDPPAALATAKQTLGPTPDATDDMRGTIERLLETRVKQLDAQAQLRLHRQLRRWLVWHVATASALIVLFVFHLITALTLL